LSAQGELRAFRSDYHPSRQAVGVVFSFATGTSTCRSKLTIRFGACFIPCTIPDSSRTHSSEASRSYKSRLAHQKYMQCNRLFTEIS
jgi:hypothetical protein